MKRFFTLLAALLLVCTADALAQTSKVQPITIRAAISVISAAPILAIYPFLQKYFVTGMALGSVKG